jgi:hypothetical protein
VRFALFVILASACSFSGEPGSPGGDDGVDAPRPPDATPDARCPDGDADGDTVCDSAEKCPGKNDLADDDADGIPDDCDDWRCGVKPAPPGTPVSVATPNRQWSASSPTIGTLRLVVAKPNVAFDYMFEYMMTVHCASGGTCKAQLEIGMSPPIGRLGCAADRDVDDNDPTSDSAAGQLMAPATPGVYEIRLNAAQMVGCGTGNLWYGAPPGGESTIAKLCVH